MLDYALNCRLKCACCNRDTASETVRTLLLHGYVLEPPTGEPHDIGTVNLKTISNSLIVMFNLQLLDLKDQSTHSTELTELRKRTQ